MVIPIANLSAVVEAAKAVATEMLPAAVTRDAVVEATRASAAWLMTHLWAWLAVARALAVDHLPAGAAAAAQSAAGSAVDASGPWIQTAAKLLNGVYGWLVAAVVEKLPDVAAERLLSDAAAWVMRGRGAAVYTTLALVLLAVAFLGGAVCALTCRTMKGPGLGGARVPRALFKTSPRRYATERAARKARRGTGCRLLPAGFVIALVAYLAAKVLC
ncbi:hypothetical protein SEVIR_9G371700v4 [Setaria viridis]|uniref:Uncharacterized protein n=2 Tax=Setaria TaxID=4554 RepID=A0A368SPJ4_SETIT|nr:uncharacterized protein LOC101764462 [Setaria italica]XP_034572134.1 uncharacterized protein LOC117836756 [Setaria viridis]RCV44346.1 hypothetical protein SETIT_9G366000v2 [Setaria italica]TKV95564.1 hypothetical protein SEVIR_9G371700v2 [Setaria viridis]